MEKKILDFLSQYITTVISVIITSILFWAFSPNDTVSIKVFIGCVIPLGIYAIITIPQQMKYWYMSDRDVKLSKLKFIQDEICMFDASDLFSIGCFVSIFYMEDYEKMIGYGKVDTIKSDNGMLQVTISEFMPNYDYQFMREHRKNIVLKPTCPFEKIMMIVEKLNQGENND